MLLVVSCRAMPLTPQLIKSLMFEHFRTERSRNMQEVANAVARFAIAKRIVPSPTGASPSPLQALGHRDGNLVADHVQQVMWQLLALTASSPALIRS